MFASGVLRAGCVGFVLGTGVGLFFLWSTGWALVFLSLTIAVSTMWFPRYAGVVLVCCWIFFGAWWHSAERLSWWRLLPDSESMLFRAEVVREPIRKEQSRQVTLRPIACSNECPDNLVLGSFPTFSDISFGDIVALSCPLERPKSFSPDVDFSLILAKDGIGYVCRFPREWRIEGESAHTAFSWLHAVRARFERGIEVALPEPESGLVAGLLIGGDDRLPERIRERFSRAGISHIVAVSGYNVSIVATLLMAILIFFGLYRQTAFWGALLGILCFMLLVGAPASAVRASIMAGTALLAMRLGRLGNAGAAVLFSASGMLLANPLLLRYDIGFQLSFAATIGILFLTPLALLSLRMGDIMATTIAAELFVFPLLLFHFHTLPTFSLVANLFVLPLVPFAMLFGFVAAIFGMVVPSLAFIVGFPAFLVSHTILALAEFFSRWTFSAIPVPNFGMGALLSSYLALFLFVGYSSRKRLSRIFSV